MMGKQVQKKNKSRKNSWNKTLIVNVSLVTIIVISLLLMVFYKGTMAATEVPDTIQVANIHRVNDPFQPDNTETQAVQGIEGTETIVYCYNIDLQTMHHAQSMVKSGEVTDAGLIYILKNGYPNTTINGFDNYDSYFITQWTIWAYKALYYNEPVNNHGNTLETLRNNHGAYSTALNTLLEGAIAARNAGTSDNYNISFKNPLTINKDSTGSYYETSWIGVNSSLAVGSYIAEVTAPSGFYIITNDGTKIDGSQLASTSLNIQQTFKIVVPTTGINRNNLNINVKIKATFTSDKVRLYTPSPADANIQDGLLTVLYPMDVTKEISTSVQIPTGKLKVIKTTVNEDGKTEQVKGAKLKIESTDDTGFTPVTWETTGEAKEFTGLIPGKTYIVTEVEAATGYVNNNDKKSYKLTAADSYTSGNNIATITMKNDYTKLQVGKVDMGSGKYIAGATLVIKDMNDKELYRIVTTEEPTLITKIPVGNYILEEVEAPKGYVINPTKIRFEVKNNGNLQQVMNKNNYTYISIADQKISINLSVAGFTIEIKDANGKVVDKYVTDGKVHTTKELPVGKYTIEETKAPAGFVCYPSPIDVYVPEKGTVAANEIIFPNDYTKVKISKVDITNEEELPGAEIEIRDSNGKVIEKWTSTDTPHEIEKLPAGKYKLVETIAPEGYVLSETAVDFEIKATGEVQMVTMKNEPKVDVPDTAVEASAVKYICGGLIIACGIGLIVYNVIDQKKKRNKK